MVLWGELSALAGAFQWAFCGVWLTRLSQKVNVVTTNAARALFALLFFVMLIPFTGGWQMFAGISARSLGALLLAVLLAQGVGDITFFMAARRIGMVRAMPIAQANPLITALLAAAFLGERFTLQTGLGAVAIVFGAYLLSSGERAAPASRPAAKVDRLGLALAATTALCWAVGYILLTPVTRTVNPVAINVIRQIIIAAWLLIVMPKPLGFRQMRALTRNEVIMLGIVSVVSSGLGSFFYVWSMKWAGASLAAILGATSPAFSTPLSILILKEKVTRRIVIGTLLIIAGVWLVLLG